MNLKSLITEYLHEAKLMQIATAKENQPWACTVYFGFDNDLNLYWVSKPTRRHSEEITTNEKVAGAIVLPHTPGDKVRGVQFQGEAEKLTKTPTLDVGLDHYSKKVPLSEERIEKIKLGEDNHNCYKITPNLVVLFDEVNFPDDPRQELVM